jgi:hypothetical protein
VFESFGHGAKVIVHEQRGINSSRVVKEEKVLVKPAKGGARKKQ